MAGDDIVKQVAERVREAIDSAEKRADEIVRQAEAEAKRIRADAEEAAGRRLKELQSALDDLQGRLSGGARSEVTPGPVTVPEPTPDPVPEPTPTPMPEPTPDPVPEPTPDPIPEPTPPPDEADPPSPDPGNGGGDQEAAARLVAMKLALDGTSRDEARKRLAADYELADVDAMLDDVYARVGS